MLKILKKWNVKFPRRKGGECESNGKRGGGGWGIKRSSLKDLS